MIVVLIAKYNFNAATLYSIVIKSSKFKTMEIETSDQLEDRPLNVGAFLQCQNSGFVD